MRLNDSNDLEVSKRNEQRQFYESALEERFSQMEAFESECEQLKQQLDGNVGKRAQQVMEETRRKQEAVDKETVFANVRKSEEAANKYNEVAK